MKQTLNICHWVAMFLNILLIAHSIINGIFSFTQTASFIIVILLVYQRITSPALLEQDNRIANWFTTKFKRT